MIVKRSNRATTFNTRIEFKQLEYFDGEYYEVDFDYLINTDVCDADIVILRVYLYDQEYFSEILFESNDTNSNSNISNIMWNKHKECFQVLGRNYSLQINAITKCNIGNHEAFVAVDNLIIRKLNDIDNNLDELCQDIRITEKPPETSTISTYSSDSTNEEEFTSELTTNNENNLSTTTDEQFSTESQTPIISTSMATSDIQTTSDDRSSTLSSDTLSDTTSLLTISISTSEDVQQTQQSSTGLPTIDYTEQTSSTITDTTSQSSTTSQTSPLISTNSSITTTQSSLSTNSISTSSAISNETQTTTSTTGQTYLSSTITSSTSSTNTTTKKSGVLFGLDLWVLILIGAVLVILAIIALCAFLFYCCRFKTKDVYPLDVTQHRSNIYGLERKYI